MLSREERRTQRRETLAKMFAKHSDDDLRREAGKCIQNKLDGKRIHPAEGIGRYQMIYEEASRRRDEREVQRRSDSPRPYPCECEHEAHWNKGSGTHSFMGVASSELRERLRMGSSTCAERVSPQGTWG